jgi:hypothetical protein
MPGGIHIRGAESAHYAGRSKGYIFWAIEDDGSVLAASEGTEALSHFRLPENVRGSYHRSTFRFIDDGADDLVRVVSLIGDDLRVFVKEEPNNGGSDWVLVRSLHLPELRPPLGSNGTRRASSAEAQRSSQRTRGMWCWHQQRRHGCSPSSSEPCRWSVSTIGIGLPARCIRMNCGYNRRFVCVFYTVREAVMVHAMTFASANR